jgi:hypothetical protein
MHKSTTSLRRHGGVLLIISRGPCACAPCAACACMSRLQQYDKFAPGAALCTVVLPCLHAVRTKPQCACAGVLHLEHALWFYVVRASRICSSSCAPARVRLPVCLVLASCICACLCAPARVHAPSCHTGVALGVSSRTAVCVSCMHARCACSTLLCKRVCAGVQRACARALLRNCTRALDGASAFAASQLPSEPASSAALHPR